MNVKEIARLLDAKVLCGEELEGLDVQSAFGSDMMSDVLAMVQEKTVLLTGLVNPHVIRTAEMLDLGCIVFVRGKEVPEELIEEANDTGIALLATEYTLYETCGRLYQAGLPGCKRSNTGDRRCERV